MSHQPEQQPTKRGRKAGWRKENAMRRKLPALRVPDHIADWLDEQATQLGISTADMIRLVLDKAKKQQENTWK